MMLWLVLMIVFLFVFKQISRLRLSKRDRQLQALREAATHAGLLVRFWTLRASGYRLCGLPESGFSYVLRWPPKYTPAEYWGLWLSATGEIQKLAGTPSVLAYEWLESFHLRFAGGWALLDISDAGIALLWQERGTKEDVADLAVALDNLMKTIVKTIK
jgi:hypothetical protein